MIDCKECEKEETRKECNGRDMRRQEMIDQIKSLDFAIIELGLYLDTHPDDQRALCMHREYCKQAKDLKDKYQKMYGPLTIFCPCNKWRWLEEPWPWFKLEPNYLLTKVSNLTIFYLSIISRYDFAIYRRY